MPSQLGGTGEVISLLCDFKNTELDLNGKFWQPGVGNKHIVFSNTVHANQMLVALPFKNVEDVDSTYIN